VHSYGPHPDASHLLAEPINGQFITPNDHDDYCLNCSQPLTLAPTVREWGGYWFHYITKDKHCRGKDLFNDAERSAGSHL
jgi:hypothetical protein